MGRGAGFNPQEHDQICSLQLVGDPDLAVADFSATHNHSGAFRVPVFDSKSGIDNRIIPAALQREFHAGGLIPFVY